MTVKATRPPAARIGLVGSSTNQSQQSFPATTSATGLKCDGSRRTVHALPTLAFLSRRAPSSIPAPQRHPGTHVCREIAAMVALADGGSRPANNRSFHEHRNSPAGPTGLLEVSAHTPLGEASRHTGNPPADIPPLDLGRREEEPGRSLNLEVVSATNVISLLFVQQGDNPLAAFKSSSVRGFVCRPSWNSTRNQAVAIIHEAPSDLAPGDHVKP